MNKRKFAGARWWKFDFHAHTPESHDFMQGFPQHIKDEVTTEVWLRRFMEEKIDCVAITDHNSGGWIDKLREKYDELDVNRPVWFRQLYLFPGVEISASGNVHILAIFGQEKGGSDISILLDAVNYTGEKGKSDEVTAKSATEVISEISKREGIAIPAHVDNDKGLFRVLRGATLGKVLENSNIFTMELLDSKFQKPQMYVDKKKKWAEVRGSDTHFRNYACQSSNKDGFGTFTWIKMDKPSIEGLWLALRDGTASVSRNMSDDPNKHADSVIEKLAVRQAKYMGRSAPLCCQFSPFLNAIIGGRGTGKSTMLEFMRLVLRREEDLPDALAQESQKYYSVGGDNLLIGESQISLIYKKGTVRYRLNWSTKTDLPPLEVHEDSGWKVAPGEIRSFFPVRIYSQKQIFELAGRPRALLKIIDEAPEVEATIIEERTKELANRYKQIEQKILDLGDKIDQENRLEGESNYLSIQIEQIEESGHQEILQSFRKRQQQLNEIENLEKNWHETVRRLGELQDVVAPADFEAQHFDGFADILQSIEETNETWRSIGKGLGDLVQEAKEIIADWQADIESAAWMRSLKADIEEYERLRIELAQQGIDPDEYPALLVQHRSLRRELQLVGEYRSNRGKLEIEKQEVFAQIRELRRKLSEKRAEFLTDVLRKSTSLVNIEVRSFGEDWDDVEEEIRSILQCGERYIRDFDHLKDVYHSNGDRKVEVLKEFINKIRSGEISARDGRFARHVRSLPQESLSDLNLWFPGDNLRITFGPKNQPIEQGSPGQKTAALLAFILSYGSEPLLLDQPEDDLDNELIYELIVQQLRETKSRRQVIVVTHNANIVVNGDAEMVFPLEVAGGETHVRRAASIQDKHVRQTICDILEGGQQAFEQRYRRIHLEN